MADVKKPSGGGLKNDAEVLGTVIGIIIGIMLIASIIATIESKLGSSFDSDAFASTLVDMVYGWFAGFRNTFIIISWIVSGLAFMGAVYAMRKWSAVMKEHNDQMRLLDEKLAGASVSDKNERWEHVTTLAASENPGDWRVAIMEADIMLDDLVTKMGYGGDTLGDKLKRIEKSDFTTLDLAWEAHKVRNRIAHHGSDFILTHRETKRIIDLYRSVFEEFDFI